MRLRRSTEDHAFRGEGFEFLIEFLLFGAEPGRVERALEASRVARGVGEAAGADGGEGRLDIQQAFPDFVFPLGDFAPPGLQVGANLVVSRADGVLAGVLRWKVLAGVPQRKVLAGDRGVAERLRFEGSGRAVRPRRPPAGEVGVGKAGRGAALLPARLDPGAVPPRGFRERRWILLRRR